MSPLEAVKFIMLGGLGLFWAGALLALGIHVGRLLGARWFGPVETRSHTTLEENVNVNLPTAIPIKIIGSVSEPAETADLAHKK